MNPVENAAPTAQETAITPELLRDHGINAEEYERMLKSLGRVPTLTELGIFSVMWSEHCSYKSSRVHLKRLPTRSKLVVQGPGENAGIIDIGDGWACAFKIESHNHPSFIEPFQGAATGVGGILRDIFTMGARPVAVMDSLRFGPITAHPSPKRRQGWPAEIDQATLHKNHSVLEGVVGGVAIYGNCFGVPNVGGETKFESCYSGNPLVNAFALGLVRRDQIFYAKAAGAGNPVIYVGSKTGRDGIHGATMASEEFSEGSEAKRPNVQVGDPFMEKLLLEACLEAMQTGAVVGIQDMGAAGLTCSTCEMGGRGGVGLEIELDLVPQRETGMTPYEIMLSESQERMLLVAEKGREDEVFARLPQVGTGRRHHRPRDWREQDARAAARQSRGRDSQRSADRRRSAVSPSDGAMGRRRCRARCPERCSWARGDELQRCLEAAAGQPEHLLQALGLRAVRLDGADQHRGRAGRRGRRDPHQGNAVAAWRWRSTATAAGAIWIPSWARCTPWPSRRATWLAPGRSPVAATNCLNFGNPEKPPIMWQFSQVIDGITKACEELETPITGGNVSFYNETLGEGIYPTPVMGVVGILEDVPRRRARTSGRPGRRCW